MSLEGYAVARLHVEGLRRSASLEREAVIDGLQSLGQVDLGLGSPVALGPGDHQASHRVWPTIIRGGQVLPFDWSQL